MAWGPNKTLILNIRCTCQDEYDILTYIHRTFRKMRKEGKICRERK